MSDVHRCIVDGVEQRAGRVLRGKWTLDRVIGVGGMAAVYAATHRNGARVAVKMLHSQLSVDATVRARFLREGYVANTVQHPGVVRVLDDDQTEDGVAFLVMELLEGEQLAERADRLGGRLPLEEVLYICDQLLDVLRAAHDRGVVHRDLKPENFFLTRAGEVKILDFGIARVKEATSTSQTSTRTGTLLGTPCFMAPEQALGRMSQIDGQSDLWALGASVFTLLTGSLVHPGDTPNEQLIAAATLPARSILTVYPDLPPAIAKVIDTALAQDKAARFSSAHVMQEALRLACGYPSPTVAIPAPSSVFAHGQRASGVTAAGAVARSASVSGPYASPLAGRPSGAQAPGSLPRVPIRGTPPDAAPSSGPLARPLTAPRAFAPVSAGALPIAEVSGNYKAAMEAASAEVAASAGATAGAVSPAAANPLAPPQLPKAPHFETLPGVVLSRVRSSRAAFAAAVVAAGAVVVLALVATTTIVWRSSRDPAAANAHAAAGQGLVAGSPRAQGRPMELRRDGAHSPATVTSAHAAPSLGADATARPRSATGSSSTPATEPSARPAASSSAPAKSPRPKSWLDRRK